MVQCVAPSGSADHEAPTQSARQAAKRFMVALSGPGIWNLLAGVSPSLAAAGANESTHESVLRQMVLGSPVVPEVCTAIFNPRRWALQKAATGSAAAATSTVSR